MKTKKSLDVKSLCSALDPQKIAFENSNEIPLRHDIVTSQPRAIEALNLALSIKDSGYNVYLSGSHNLGRTYMLNNYLQPKVKSYPTPPDLVYVYNFNDPDAPILISVPAGVGSRFKSLLSKAIAKIRKVLPVYMERESYTHRRSALQGDFYDKKAKLIEEMEAIAAEKNFILDLDNSGSMTLAPLVNNERLNEKDFDSLSPEQQAEIKEKGDALALIMHSYLRRQSKLEQNLMDEERQLERSVASVLISSSLRPVGEKLKSSVNGSFPVSYFEALQEDILDNLESFITPELTSSTPAVGQMAHLGLEQHSFDDIAHRYVVNLFVDNSKSSGGPIVIEDNPTQANLLGCVEREAEMGALVTNFSLIKAGSLHRANGGFLVLQVEDLLQYPHVWEGLLRALRSGQAKLDDSAESEGTKTKGLSPDPIQLDLKVILVGTEEFYEILLVNDSRFSKLFKIKAQMARRMPMCAKNIKSYLLHIRRIIEEAKLYPFNREALAALVDFGSMLLLDKKRLSLEFPLLREIMIEASAQAKMHKASLVTAGHLSKAIKSREFRLNLVEESFLEEYDRKVIKVQSKGEAIGVANGLSVTDYGDFEFGLPHQISCTVGVGHGGIIDLEREAELGGPIHTKAMMIIKSYLVSLFARKQPLILTGSICFEQSYAGIEGDSASGAELASLLSAIAEVPINLSLAFTGALSQSGQIMAVGGVNRKVEGFFAVCQRHGLTGKQGVILPKDTLDNLILKPSVLDAIGKGQFHIYPVMSIQEAMELLTGIPCGNLRKDGSFTPNSLFDKVDKRLKLLTKLAAKAEHRGS